jgi:hypothetical protein
MDEAVPVDTTNTAVLRRGLTSGLASLIVGLVGCSGGRSPPSAQDTTTKPDEVSEALDGDTNTASEKPELIADDMSENPVDTGADEVDASEVAADAGDGDAADVPVAPRPFCESLSGSGSIELPEASAAVRFSDGMALVVADSGHRGRAVWVSPEGATTAVQLPLDPISRRRGTDIVDDDLEGLAIGTDGRLYGLTSAGWLRVWTRDGTDFTQVGSARPISDHPDFVCDSRAVNCGPNYEGLCLRPSGWDAPAGPSAPCVGYAASKARGELVCLVASDGESPLRVEPSRVLATGLAADHLSDCAFIRRADGSAAVLVAGNLYAGSELRMVDEVSGQHVSTDIFGAINQEALLDRGDGTWWSLGDLQQYSETSPWQTFRCGAPPAR